MSKREMAEIYRNPQTRAEQGFVSPIGEVDKEELMSLAGASEVTPNTTSVPCGLFVTAAFCPTTACSSSC
ncbi:class II lanthipeptide, LchA2/BrtA2 family [Priestia megaterium]|uniref:class II lanthipeptide, LchA2/BrtA2 family n=1 Tax=Priestia megaterium TaxID=1404 RepID=UPI002E1DB722|nr:class II lanthipeptide, LchA2/BrtA2 family [Priestia megaterium]